MKKLVFAVLLCGLLIFACGTAAASTWATIDPIEDVILGDNVTFSGDTNVRVDQDVFVRIYHAGDVRNGKEQLTQLTILRAPAAKGDGLYNQWSVTMPTGNTYLGEFLVTAESSLPKDGARFNVSVESDGWWITIDPIPDYPAGSAFTITGTTNIREGYKLFCELCPAWIYSDTTSIPAPANCQYNWSVIEKGENGVNIWSVPVNTTYPEKQIWLNQTHYPPETYVFSITALYSVDDPHEQMQFNLTDPATETPVPTKTQAPGFAFVTVLVAAAAARMLTRK